MNCNKCQAELPEENKFCLKCGEKVEWEWKKDFEDIKAMIKITTNVLITWNSFLDKNPDIKKKYLKFIESQSPKGIKTKNQR